MRALLGLPLRIAMLVMCLALAGLTVGAPAPSAHAATASPTVSISADPLNTGQDLTAHVTITNPNAVPITDGMLRIGVGETLFSSATAYTAWVQQGATATALTYLGPTAYVARTDPIPAQSTVTRTIQIQNRFIQLAGVEGHRGVLPLGVKLSLGSTFVAAAASGVAWNLSAETPASFSLLVPIVAPPTTNAYYTREELLGMIRDGGTLNAQLTAVAGAPVALAVDPKIVGSIQHLGRSVPGELSAWLERLREFPSVTPLMWGNADPIAVATRQSVSVSPSLVSQFPWQHADWLVAAPGRLRTNVLKYAGRAGYRAIVATDTQLDGTLSVPTTHNLAVAINLGAPTAAVSDYLSSGRDDDLATAVNLATISVNTTSYRGTPLITLPTSWSQHPDRVGRILSTIQATGWLHPEPTLSLATGQTTRATLATSGKSLLPRADVRPLLDRYVEVRRFSTVLDHPQSVATTSARQLGSLLTAAWHGQTDAWRDGRTQYLAASHRLLTSIHVASESKLTLVARTSQVPVVVQNSGSMPATVLVRIQPTNGRVVAPQPAKVRVPAANSVTAKVPVRALANGHVDLRIQLLTPDGKRLGPQTTRHMLVRSQWETLSFLVLGTAVVGLFVVGLIRGFRRNRRNRDADAAGDSSTAPDVAPNAAPTATPDSTHTASTHTPSTERATPSGGDE